VWDPKKYGFVHGISVEEGKKLIFVSGQNGIDTNGQVVSGDFEAQCSKSFENVSAILANAGCTPLNIVKLTAYVTDITNADAFVRISSEFFKGEFCTQTLVEVSALAFPELKVEIEAIAII
jgi:2-iminobutanoate/2-iminopropanoate deaminase